MSQPQFLLFPPKSDRGRCSRLSSVLLCIIFLQTHGLVLSHASPFVAQNISPPTQYVVSFIGSPFWRQKCFPPPLPEYMLPHGIDFLSCEIYTNSFNFNKHGNKEKLSINNFSSFICNIVDEKSFLEIKRGDFNNKRKFNNVPYSPYRLSKEIRIVWIVFNLHWVPLQNGSTAKHSPYILLIWDFQKVVFLNVFKIGGDIRIWSRSIHYQKLV